MHLGFIGAGNVGTALASALSSTGWLVVAVASERHESARALAARIPGCAAKQSGQDVLDVANLVFLAVPDDDLMEVTAGLTWRAGVAAVHCSGASGLEILAPAARAGAQVGAFHPLRAFPNRNGGAASFEGCAVAIEGAEPLLTDLRSMALAVGANPIVLPAGARRLYHTSAALASNFLVTLVDQAAKLWGVFGIGPGDTLKALLPLVHSTVENLEALGLPDALTGPIARGDVNTVRAHLEALRAQAPEMLALYCQLGLATIPIALDKGTLQPQAAEELKALLVENCLGDKTQACE